MATEFHAYLKADKIPSPDTLIRALCSRGWTFSIAGEQALDERSGDLGLSVDGTDHAVAVSSLEAGTPAWKALAASAGDREDGEEFAKVLKNTNMRLTFAADGDAEKWARDVCRGAALLAVGAYENAGTGKLIYYGG